MSLTQLVGDSGTNTGSPGEGLYNVSSLDENNDGTAEETDDVFADLPHILSYENLSRRTSKPWRNAYQAPISLEIGAFAFVLI